MRDSHSQRPHSSVQEESVIRVLSFHSSVSPRQITDTQRSGGVTDEMRYRRSYRSCTYSTTYCPQSIGTYSCALEYGYQHLTNQSENYILAFNLLYRDREHLDLLRGKRISELTYLMDVLRLVTSRDMSIRRAYCLSRIPSWFASIPNKVKRFSYPLPRNPILHNVFQHFLLRGI
jgi:hypothetical protein